MKDHRRRIDKPLSSSVTLRIRPERPTEQLPQRFRLLKQPSPSGVSRFDDRVWLAFGIAIIAFNLWAAFAKKGSVQTITSDDDEPPTRFGMDVTKQ